MPASLGRLGGVAGRQHQLGNPPAVVGAVLAGRQPQLDQPPLPLQLGPGPGLGAVVLDRGVQVDHGGQRQAAQPGAEQLEHGGQGGGRLGRAVQADQDVDRTWARPPGVHQPRPLPPAVLGGDGQGEGQRAEKGAEQPPGKRVVAAAAHAQGQQHADPSPEHGQGTQRGGRRHADRLHHHPRRSGPAAAGPTGPVRLGPAGIR
jgi:hypothetical protein